MKLRQLAGLALAAAVLATGAARAADMSPEKTALYEAAKKEGEVTWYVSHFTTEFSERLGAEFTQLYPGIRVNVVRATAQVIYQRLNQDLLAGTTVDDVFSTTDNSQYGPLKQQGLLASYVPESAAGVFPTFQNFDPDNQVQATSGAMIIIMYRSDKIADADAPTSWKDLTDPRFKGQLAFGHPGFSGQVGVWTVALNKLYGWSYFEALAANDPQIGRSINDVTTMLSSGERLVGHSGDGPMRRSAMQDGAPYKSVYPSDGAVMTIGGSAVLANAPHPNAARLFLDFLMDKPASALRVQEEWGMSIRPDVDPSPGAKRPDEIPLLNVSTEELAQLPELIDRWRDLFGS